MVCMLETSIHLYRKLFGTTDAELKRETVESFTERVNENIISSDGIASHRSDGRPDTIIHPDSAEYKDQYMLCYVPITNLHFVIDAGISTRNFSIGWVKCEVEIPIEGKMKIGIGYPQDVFTLCEYLGIGSLDELEDHRVPVMICWDEVGETVDNLMYELGRIERELRGEKKTQQEAIVQLENDNNIWSQRQRVLNNL